MDQNGFSSQPRPLSYSTDNVGVIASFMNAVYAWMGVGLGVTALVAWMTSQNEAMRQMVFQPMTFIVLIVAELALVWYVSSAINRLSVGTATSLFVLYSALNGLTLSVVFLRYQLGTVGAAFLITAGTFGITSFIGFVTRKDLSGLGGLCFMALIGLILASIVNYFVSNEMLFWIINYAGVLIFVGLTAYDTQKIKQFAYQTQGDSLAAGRMSVLGSLMLYLDFINLMLFMLRILGGKRR